MVEQYFTCMVGSELKPGVGLTNTYNGDVTEADLQCWSLSSKACSFENTQVTSKNAAFTKEWKKIVKRNRTFAVLSNDYAENFLSLELHKRMKRHVNIQCVHAPHVFHALDEDDSPLSLTCPSCWSSIRPIIDTDEITNFESSSRRRACVSIFQRRKVPCTSTQKFKSHRNFKGISPGSKVLRSIRRAAANQASRSYKKEFPSKYADDGRPLRNSLRRAAARPGHVHHNFVSSSDCVETAVKTNNKVLDNRHRKNASIGKAEQQIYLKYQQDLSDEKIDVEDTLNSSSETREPNTKIESLSYQEKCKVPKMEASMSLSLSQGVKVEESGCSTTNNGESDQKKVNLIEKSARDVCVTRSHSNRHINKSKNLGEYTAIGDQNKSFSTDSSQISETDSDANKKFTDDAGKLLHLRKSPRLNKTEYCAKYRGNYVPTAKPSRSQKRLKFQ